MLIIAIYVHVEIYALAYFSPLMIENVLKHDNDICPFSVTHFSVFVIAIFFHALAYFSPPTETVDNVL